MQFRLPISVAAAMLLFFAPMLSGAIRIPPPEAPHPNASPPNRVASRPTQEPEGGMREWTSKGGKFKTRGRFVSLVGDTVKLNLENGKSAEFDVERLEETDQDVAFQLASRQMIQGAIRSGHLYEKTLRRLRTDMIVIKPNTSGGYTAQVMRLTRPTQEKKLRGKIVAEYMARRGSQPNSPLQLLTCIDQNRAVATNATVDFPYPGEFVVGTAGFVKAKGVKNKSWNYIKISSDWVWPLVKSKAEAQTDKVVSAGGGFLKGIIRTLADHEEKENGGGFFNELQTIVEVSEYEKRIEQIRLASGYKNPKWSRPFGFDEQLQLAKWSVLVNRPDSKHPILIHETGGGICPVDPFVSPKKMTSIPGDAIPIGDADMMEQRLYDLQGRGRFYFSLGRDGYYLIFNLAGLKVIRKMDEIKGIEIDGDMVFGERNSADDLAKVADVYYKKYIRGMLEYDESMKEKIQFVDELTERLRETDRAMRNESLDMLQRLAK